MKEVWKDINERYQVSNMGRVKRLAYTQYNPLNTKENHWINQWFLL